MTQQPDEQQRIAQLFHDLFVADRRGQVVYDYLYRKFAKNARVHTSGGIDAVLSTYHDAARASVIRHITDLMERGAAPVDSLPAQEEGQDASSSNG